MQKQKRKLAFIDYKWRSDNSSAPLGRFFVWCLRKPFQVPIFRCCNIFQCCRVIIICCCCWAARSWRRSVVASASSPSWYKHTVTPTTAATTATSPPAWLVKRVIIARRSSSLHPQKIPGERKVKNNRSIEQPHHPRFLLLFHHMLLCLFPLSYDFDMTRLWGNREKNYEFSNPSFSQKDALKQVPTSDAAQSCSSHLLGRKFYLNSGGLDCPWKYFVTCPCFVRSCRTNIVLKTYFTDFLFTSLRWWPSYLQFLSWRERIVFEMSFLGCRFALASSHFISSGLMVYTWQPNHIPPTHSIRGFTSLPPIEWLREKRATLGKFCLYKGGFCFDSLSVDPMRCLRPP